MKKALLGTLITSLSLMAATSWSGSKMIQSDDLYYPGCLTFAEPGYTLEGITKAGKRVECDADNDKLHWEFLDGKLQNVSTGEYIKDMGVSHLKGWGRVVATTNRDEAQRFDLSEDGKLSFLGSQGAMTFYLTVDYDEFQLKSYREAIGDNNQQVFDYIPIAGYATREGIEVGDIDLEREVITGLKAQIGGTTSSEGIVDATVVINSENNFTARHTNSDGTELSVDFAIEPKNILKALDANIKLGSTTIPVGLAFADNQSGLGVKSVVITSKNKIKDEVNLGNQYITYKGPEIRGFNSNDYNITSIEAEFSGGSIGRSNYTANFQRLGDESFIAYFKGGIHWKAIFLEVRNNKLYPTKVGYKTGTFSTNPAHYRSMRLATAKWQGGYGLTNITVKYALKQ